MSVVKEQPVARVTFQGYRCERCGHQWVPRQTEEPRVCPKCKNPYWNRPRRVPKVAAVKARRGRAQR